MSKSAGTRGPRPARTASRPSSTSTSRSTSTPSSRPAARPPARRPSGDRPPPSDRVVAARRRLVLAGFLGLLALAAGFAYGRAVSGSEDTVREGTTVLGIDISGLAPDAAVARLKEEIGPLSRDRITVNAGDKAFPLKPRESGLRFDAEATVAAAMATVWNPLELLGLMGGGGAVEPVRRIDEEAVRSQVDMIAKVVNSKPEEPSLAYEGLRPVLTQGAQGQRVDAAEATSAIADAYLSVDSVDIPVIPIEPTVSADEARQVRDGLARAAVAEGIRVDVDQTLATIPASAIAGATTFVVANGTLEPRVDGDRLHDDIADQLVAVETRGRDASFDVVDGRPIVVPSVDGREIDNDTLAESVLEVLPLSGEERIVTASIVYKPPKLTTADAQALGITEQISTYTQEFPYAAYRVQNIGQAAAYVDGTVLEPGDTFSMNDTIKERTAANGYTKGTIIGPGGVFAEAMGGGVSTATTAVWTAAFYAGLERVYTQAHSIYISRYAPGLEATVSWGEFDMRFRNDTDHGVLITTEMTRTSMTVTMWGTKAYDEVKAEFGPRMDLRPFETIYDTSDACLGQEGMPGFRIDVVRVFLRGGKEVKRETITTVYDPSPKVVCGPEPPRPADGQAPVPSPGASESARPEPSVEASPGA